MRKEPYENHTDQRGQNKRKVLCGRHNRICKAPFKVLPTHTYRSRRRKSPRNPLRQRDGPNQRQRRGAHPLKNKRHPIRHHPRNRRQTTHLRRPRRKDGTPRPHRPIRPRLHHRWQPRPLRSHPHPLKLRPLVFKNDLPTSTDESGAAGADLSGVSD